MGFHAASGIIKAPFDQGDIIYFDEDAGKQCVAIAVIT